jgi:hypothetical protein
MWACAATAPARHFYYCYIAIAAAVGNPSQITGAYLMAFHACDSAVTNCRDPRYHQVYLAQSNDGTTWNLISNWQPFPGSVPDVIRRGDTLYIYTARNEVARYHLEANTLEAPVKVSIAGVPTGFVDPSLIRDDQGRLVLFFLYGQPGSDPAGCLPGQTICTKRFGSATEVVGSDGTQFTLDDGDRAIVTLSASGPLRSASDPDIFFDGTQHVLYLSHGPSISVWTSPDLRGAYKKIGDLSQGTGGVPAGHFDPASKQYWTYSHIQKSGVAVIRRAVHKDFSRSLAENDWETVFTGASVGLSPTTYVESPGFTVNTTGGTANESQTAGLIVTIGIPTGKTIKPLLGVNVGPIPAGNDPRNADLTTAYQQSWR